MTKEKAQKLQQDGNFKEAFEAYRSLILGPAPDQQNAHNCLKWAVECLRLLQQERDQDALCEAAVAAHPKNWRVLQVAAEMYFHSNHQGFLIAGQFERGQHRGGGQYANCEERDRIRALQLMRQAFPLLEAETDRSGVGIFYLALSDMLMGFRGYDGAWQLQVLSDLETLPDYEEGYGGRFSGAQGAPVDEAGNPVFYSLPKSFAEARNDGERWRWTLMQAVETDPNRTDEVLTRRAQFAENQFGVQTLAQYGSYFNGRPSESDRKSETGTFQLHTLGEDETIARLATGVKRFKLPDEYNAIFLLKQIAEKPQSGYGEQACNRLAETFENRRQYPRAAEYWRKSIEKYKDPNGTKQKQLNQIVQNWGEFEPVLTQPAGQGATVDFRFRNGQKVHFKARAINMEKLFTDLKEYLKSNPKELKEEKIALGDLGLRFVQEKQTEYLEAVIAEWDLDLEPLPNHFDKRITVTTPLQKSGAYFLEAQMADGNTSHIVVWLTNTVIVQKQMQNQSLYYIADARTGAPVEKANVEFFGYKVEFQNNPQSVKERMNIRTLNFAEFSDANGLVTPTAQNLSPDYQYVAIARGPETGRFALFGFSNVWYSPRHDVEYNAMKFYLITDRPVYRPKQEVKFKVWVREAQYDQPDASRFANQNFPLTIYSPRNEKVLETAITTDAYGGWEGQYALEDEAPLGTYRIVVNEHNAKERGPHQGQGQGTFRVEEYKKPEFEVTVEAPQEPVMLGEKIEALVKAKYYFGAPVTNAKVKYKVNRTPHDARWYPPAVWDWFYGAGYWWFGYDYGWYPGWKSWGCLRPHFIWWPQQRHDPPEVVAEGEVSIGKDGTLRIPIDTALAKEMHGDQDHKYEISAEVTDESRRTIVGTGSVLVAREPFKVHAWGDRGYYRVGEVIEGHFAARRLDGKPVQGNAALKLFKITYDKDSKPVETVAQEWTLATGEDGLAFQQMKASEPGQYRLSCTVTDSKGHRIEGAYIFTVRGEGFDGKEFRFSEIELVSDKREYAPGEKVQLAINTDQVNATVLLFIRPANGVCLAPKVLRLQGKSAIEEIEVSQKDMPNFFVEALTVSDGKIYTEVREIVVPPEKRVLNVSVEPSSEKYKPGEKAKVKVKVTELDGKPFTGSLVMSVYDKSVEYISGGSNVPEIKEFFWKWRRGHTPRTQSNLDLWCRNWPLPDRESMENLGIFGETVADESGAIDNLALGQAKLYTAYNVRGLGGGARPTMRAMAKSDRLETKGEAVVAYSMVAPAAAPAAEVQGGIMFFSMAPEGAGEAPLAEATVRKEFADTAFWAGTLATDANGVCEVEVPMPENLTTWKIRSWALGHGTKVGEGSAEVVTSKNLLLRLQAPRFFVEKDEVVLSANIHNYLQDAQNVQAVLEIDGKSLEPMGETKQTVQVEANGEGRVDWRVKAVKEGEAVVRMKALTQVESDAMQMTFPVYVHGMLKTESFSGVIRPEKENGTITLDVPEARRIDESRLEVRYSPTLAGAMVDALPYLVDYPYGCTEQTLNRFLPTVMTQKILQEMGLNLKAIQEKRTNLNAQEIGNDAERAKQWQRYDRNPVFEEETVRDMVKNGVQRLTSMQLSDGGWGWFSGFGEHSSAHTTAYVVHGLQMAAANGVALVPGVLEKGIQWLKRNQAEEIQKIENWAKDKEPKKQKADNLDAFVYMVLTDANAADKKMGDFLYRDRNDLAVYAKSMLALAFHKQNRIEERDMLRRNIEQFLKQDDENQTAWLELGNEGYWWCWYGSEYEAQAYYLKLLAQVDPKSEIASRLVKYLLNNRKHATYWKSTRDTALCVEAFADYLRATGEMKPELTLEVLLDGKKQKEITINAENLFTFDNKFVLFGDAVETGKHTVELRKKGTGALYFNAYLTNFTLEDFITQAGLEVKIDRKYYKLKEVDKQVNVAGARGQAVSQKTEKYERIPIENLGTLKSGDMAEIELVIESKNDYEYIVIEDMKAAGFEPVEVRSGYNGNALGAYLELRDERVCFFVQQLARGKHSVSYRMRAETPGQFSALPARISAMYAPELKGNSDEIKVRIED
jgi:uncharacterized protein YfaS (alpha-2-macroglobulin family)